MTRVPLYNYPSSDQFLVSLTDTEVQASFDNSTNSSMPLLFIPTSSSDPTPIGFADSSNVSSSVNTTGFGFYGAWLYHLDAQGEITMNWYAVPTDDSSTFQLNWWDDGTVNNSANAIAVSLRTIAPTTKTKRKV